MSQNLPYNQMLSPFRIPRTGFLEAPGLSVYSGINEGYRSLTLGVKVGGAERVAGIAGGGPANGYTPGVVQIRLEGARRGAPYVRDLHLAPNVEVQIDLAGLQNLEVRVLACNIIDLPQSPTYDGTIVLQGSGPLIYGGLSKDPPDPRYPSYGFSVVSYNANMYYRPPPGAVDFLPQSADPGFAWQAYPLSASSGTVESFVAPLNPGTAEPVRGPSFFTTVAQEFLWRVLL